MTIRTQLKVLVGVLSRRGNVTPCGSTGLSPARYHRGRAVSTATRHRAAGPPEPEEPARPSTAPLSAFEVSQLAGDAAQGDGWVVSFGFRQPVMTCPGCADGRGPVRERGDCRRCMGRVDAESGCLYCLRQVEPQPEA